MSFTYEYARPSVTVDCVVFGVEFLPVGATLNVLLVERADAPFKGRLALPGGFVQMKEALDAAARRELREETGLHDLYLEQLFTYGAPGRDPRGRVISVAYYGLVRKMDHVPQAGSDARRAEWVPVEIPGGSGRLAFDHADILAAACARLRAKIRYEPVGFRLLPETFTLPRLQELYEAILGRPIDKANFRRRISATGLLLDAGREQGVRRKPAQIYRFDRERYDALRARGFDFKF